MKKLSTMFILLGMTATMFTACSIPKHITVHDYIDYQKYLDDGFYISETEYANFNYTPVGHIQVWQREGEVCGETHEKQIIPYIKEETINTFRWFYPNQQAILDYAVEKAKENGANGILKLNIKRINKSELSFILDGITIKRID